MTTSKKTATHTNHVTKSNAAATSTEEASPNPTTAAVNPQPDLAGVTAAAKAAVTLISQAQSALPLTAGLGLKARKSAIKSQVFPSELLAESASFLAEHGASYPMFNAQDAQHAADLEQALNTVVASATTLINRAQSTVLEHRAPAIEQALALYATLKAQSRTDSTARATVARMEPLVNTRKTPHQKKLQREKAKVKKIAKLSAPTATPSAAPSATTETPAGNATPAPAAGTNGASAPTATTHS